MQSLLAQQHTQARTACAPELNALRGPPACPTPECIAIQWPNCQPFLGHNTNLYCDPFPIQASLLYYNTVLGIAIQCLNSLTLSCHNIMPFLQYNWAVAQIIFCTKIIFIFQFFFLQLLENTKKIHILFFFSFFQNTQIIL